MRIPQKPPEYKKLLEGSLKTGKFITVLNEVASGTVEGRYLHWDELRYRKPPEGLSNEEWWLGLKMRRASVHSIPLEDRTGVAFRFGIPDLVTDLLHQIDRGAGTVVQIPEQITNKDQRDHYLIRSLMEEAITSSQLEGAATTREVAKKMLAEGRKPRDRSEQMIANNYATMRRILELKDQPLTPEIVFQIHREISQGTLDIENGAGRFRRQDEDINVSALDGTVFHVPPAADQLQGRLQVMCNFANGETPGFFVHPIIRGIILHFWLAYDHPFVDGNGRTARAIFYWEMLHSGYWLFEFISISHALRKAPVKYGTAFLHTETDDNDLTYFIINQAEVIRQSLKELHEYVSRKSSETRACLDLLHRHPDLNHRQQALIGHAVRHPGFVYRIAGHQSSHGVTYATARADLLKLSQASLLDKRKSGRAFVFIAPKNLEAKLRSKTV